MLLAVLCLLLSVSVTSFADGIHTSKAQEISKQDIQTIQRILEQPNQNGTPGRIIFDKSKDTNESISTSILRYSTITPVLIRDYHTSLVQVYLVYEGNIPANALKFTTFKIKSTSLIFPYTYDSFPGRTYNFGVVSTLQYVYLGEAVIPSDVDKVRVSDSGLQAFQPEFGWVSHTNIIGEWPIN